jgi:DnaJ-domain-containing protein 1
MLSSVISSEQAIEVNIAIMRVFVQMRQMLSSNSELQRKIELLEGKYDEQFATVFQAIKQLMVKEREPRKAIGYRSS